ncbi:MAG: ErfK/YbiS/YcfS/YnhG family protein [Pedosphaera sp.]|nr:ErfK/YbiS/YcfS/YnhG family protein [Pedosphaera sp.]
MPRRSKLQLSNSKNKSSGLYWVLTIALAILLGWFWWKSGKPAQPKSTSGSKLTPSELSPVKRSNVSSVGISNSALFSTAPTKLPSRPVTVETNPIEPQLNTFPRPVQNAFEGQLALAQQAISPGSIDGVMGFQTEAALMTFQHRTKLPATGQLDQTTRTNLLLIAPQYTNYTITSDDLGRLQPVASTWLGKSQQTALDYENILELVAERGFASPTFIRRLNPNIDWTNLVAGTSVKIPNAFYPEVHTKAAFVKIHLTGKTLEAFDANDNLLAHFPCSIARRVEKRPVGELHVAVVAPNPNYTFDPDVFPESAEAQKLGRKLILPPGPNNPVGVAWIGLDKPGYGIHGTPKPEEVGRTESHGCFRLANWNAEYLLRLITVGTTVYVVE